MLTLVTVNSSARFSQQQKTNPRSSN